jgi:hypothetical protein
MTRPRLLFVVGILALLTGLMLWQRHREGLMTACLERGGYWNGPRSTCEPSPFSPILKRALERS